MASGQTANYNLNQWEAGDYVLRTEFNEDNEKIDGALAGVTAALAEKAAVTALTSLSQTVPKFAYGRYVGNGSATRTISVGFTPKAVFVFPQNSNVFERDSSYYTFGGLAVSGSDTIDYGGQAAISIKSGGFQVLCKSSGSYYAYTNASNSVYHYLALG